jgi:hypothetical protein
MLDGERISVAIAQEIAAVEGTDPEKLPPLYDSIDTDALNALITHSDAQDLTIDFDYGSYRIHIEGTDEITVSPCERRAEEVTTKSYCD